MSESIARESLHPVTIASYFFGVLGPILAVLGGLQHFGGFRRIPDDDAENEEPLILFVAGIVLYLLHLCEALCRSRTSKYLWNVLSEREFQDYIVEVQNAAPIIEWTIQNYHYDTNTTTNKDGKERTERKRVNTKFAAGKYDIRGFMDETLSPQQTMAMFHLLHDGELDTAGDVETGKHTRKSHARQLVLLCHMPLEFFAINDSELARLENHRRDFYQRNTTDTHQDKGENQLLSCQHRSHAMVVLNADTDDSASRPLWMNFSVFLLCTVFLLSIPYRLYLFFQTQKITWSIYKHYAHIPVETWQEEPEYSRSKCGDRASQAFRARPRETALRSNVPSADIQDAWVGEGDEADKLASMEIREGPPAYWKNQDLRISFDDKIKLSDVDRQKMQTLVDATFKMKATRDRHDELPSKLIVEQVLRIEDSAMWKRYEAKRSFLSRRPRPVPLAELPGSGKLKTAPRDEDEAQRWPDSLKDLTTDLNEAYLFHGSNPGGALGIGENGFDMSRVGKNVGTMFGAGAYFAEASSKSDEYGSQDPSGVFAGRYAFLLCRVLLGNMFHITESNIPRIEDALATGRFHAVLGDRESVVDTYREFVVFDEDQIYPEYVIIYRRVFQ